MNLVLVLVCAIVTFGQVYVAEYNNNDLSCAGVPIRTFKLEFGCSKYGLGSYYNTSCINGKVTIAKGQGCNSDFYPINENVDKNTCVETPFSDNPSKLSCNPVLIPQLQTEANFVYTTYTDAGCNYPFVTYNQTKSTCMWRSSSSERLVCVNSNSVQSYIYAAGDTTCFGPNSSNLCMYNGLKPCTQNIVKLDACVPVDGTTSSLWVKYSSCTPLKDNVSSASLNTLWLWMVVMVFTIMIK